ncbi:biotin transport system substrate-specific component [Roseiarcus fermentans]|uniref:Biotin transporter n=1 Tax=Roseiarcus fermentans TaxID=1473586 RepID=A0A366FW34_9HYPH|nr:biotin transporter BioY [Roseiarcus fermentans]RBP18240.1 biotin transport system substrate-specific component [Roseiarcus fermentans]
MTAALDATLVSTLWPANPTARLARDGALVLTGALVLAVSAKVQVPFIPVPMTLQSLAVLVLAAAYGLRLGAAAVAFYLVEGLLGAPVFAGALAGPAYMAGPTGGYLAGFLVAAALVGFLAERGWDRSWPRLLAAMTIGHGVIFAFGFVWLAVLIGPEKAFALGVVPFALATVVKTLLAVALVGAAWNAVKQMRAA